MKKLKKSKDNFHDKWEQWEKEAQRRSAWGQYAQQMYQLNEEEDSRKLMYGTDQQKKEVLEKRKNRTPMLYIG